MTKTTERDEKFAFHTKARNLAILSEMSKALDRECRGSTIATVATLEYRGFNVVPHKDGGIVMMAQCRYGSVIIRDPEGRISSPYCLTFPKRFLKKCRRPKLLERMDENCQTYDCEESVPEFMIPDVASAIFCGAFINGSGDLPDGDDSSGIFSCRAEWGNNADDWSLGIAPLRIDPARVSDIVRRAPDLVTTTTITSPALMTVARVMEAHRRESDPDRVGIWYSRTIGEGQKSIIIHRNAEDPDIAICVSSVENRSQKDGKVRPLDDERMHAWLSCLTDEVAE